MYFNPAMQQEAGQPVVVGFQLAYSGAFSVLSAIYKSIGILFIIFILSCSQRTSETCILETAKDIDNSEAPAMIDYNDFLDRIEKISTGTDKAHVETILGEPASRSDTIWSYDLRNRRGFPGIPPASGTTVFVGIDIVFEEGRAKDISRKWIDVTGPGQ